MAVSNRDTRTSKDPKSQNGVNSYNMSVSYKGSLLTVTSPGGKSITIDLSKIEDENLEPKWVATLDRLDALRIERGNDFTCLMLTSTLSYLPLIKAVEGKPVPGAPPAKVENLNLKALSIVDGKDTTVPQSNEVEEVKEVEQPSTESKKPSKLEQFVRITQEAQAEGLQKINRRKVAATPALVERVNVLRSIARSNLELWCVNYDIPNARDEETGARLTRGVVPNPSGEWWAYGARLTLSQWLFTKEGLENPVIQERIQNWLDRPQKDIKVRVVKQCPTQTELLRGWAREKLEEMVSQAQQSMINCLASAHQRWEAAEKALQEMNLAQHVLSVRRRHALSKRDQDTRNVLRTAAMDLNNAIQCAERFDMTEDVRDLLEALRLAVQSQQQSFNAEARAREATPSRVHIPEIQQ